MLFIQSPATARRHGAYAYQRQASRTAKPAGTGVVAMVGQFPWGPAQTLMTPEDTAAYLNTFAPKGMNRLASGYLAILGKQFPTMRIVRVMPSTGTASASAVLTKTGPVNVVTLTAKYPGTAGNSLVAVVSNANDGDANHFNLTVSVTGASGITTDSFPNLNYSGTGTDSAPDFSAKVLVGAIAKNTAGRPANGTYVFSGGLDGTITAADYVGTPGAGDRGISLLEGDSSIDHVFVDDCGNSLRAAVNAGLIAHSVACGDRIVYLNGNSGQTAASSAQADVASYRDVNAVYVDPWYYGYDDVTGAEQLIPPSGLAASVAANLSPSTSPAWKSDEAGQFFSHVNRPEFLRSASAADNTDAGIMTLIVEPAGGHRFEAGVVTIAPSDASKKNITRSRMNVYIAKSLLPSLRPFTDGPNVDENQVAIVSTVQGFMDGLVLNKTKDPNHLPYVDAYAIPALAEFNSKSDLANGSFTVPIDAKYGSNMERIFIALQAGEGVTITTK